jgi:hypothetical protein
MGAPREGGGVPIFPSAICDDRRAYLAARCGDDGMLAGAWCWCDGLAAHRCKRCGSFIHASTARRRCVRRRSHEPKAPGGGHVIADNVCACWHHYSQYRRYRIGCGQETKSPAQQRLAASGRRSKQRRALQPIQSRAHRRRQPWLQSKPHDLEVKPGSQIPQADPLLARCPRRAPPVRFMAQNLAFTRARSSLPAPAD